MDSYEKNIPIKVDLIEKWGEKWGKNEKKIISIISQNKKATILYIVDQTSLSASGVEKIINRLKERNILKRIGAAKGGHWEIIDK